MRGRDEPEIVWKEPGDPRHRGLVESLFNSQLADVLTENGYRRLGVEVQTRRGHHKTCRAARALGVRLPRVDRPCAARGAHA